MSPRERRSTISGRIAAIVSGLVAAAIALYIVVHLLEAVLVPLLVIAAIGLALFVIGALLQRWYRAGRW